LRHLNDRRHGIAPHIPIALTRTTGNKPERASSAIDNRFTSVMMDGIAPKRMVKTPADYDYNVR